MNQHIDLHTRHIPAEHLKASRLDAYRRRIMTTLDPDVLHVLKERGVGTVELRLVWWELEPEPGRFDWSRFDRDLELVERHGLKAGLMAWFNHPPAWYHHQPARAACFTCLEHGLSTTTLSPWDPKTLDIMERLYAATAARYRSRLDFVYVTSCGDYGEPVVPQGVSAYRFSSAHSHDGAFWCGDPHARVAWRATLQRQYGGLDALNVAWGTAFRMWDDDLFAGLPAQANPVRRMDFLRWLADTTSSYTASIFRLIKRNFPKARTAVPIGHVEDAIHGQSKSLCVKRLAEVSKDLVARWTGMAYFGDFAMSNILAKRVSSIARFYGVGFGEETAFEIVDPVVACYECLANGASMVHDDLASYRHGGLAAQLTTHEIDPPVSDTAVFYPCEAEQLEAFEPRCPKLWSSCGARHPVDADCGKRCLAKFFAAAAELRALRDYELCDSLMIADGFLHGVTTMVFVASTVIPERILPMLEQFAARQGKVVLANRASVTVLETGMPYAGTESLPVLPRCPRHDGLRRDGTEFTTFHRRHLSYYNPARQRIIVDQEPGDEIA